jgi:hypothetical protein
MRLQTVLTASSFVLSKQMIMKYNYTPNFYYVLFVVIVLLVYPLKNYSAIVSNQSQSIEKVEMEVTQPSPEMLHGELLFK